MPTKPEEPKRPADAKVCEHCGGTGLANGGRTHCPHCKGKGYRSASEEAKASR